MAQVQQLLVVPRVFNHDYGKDYDNGQEIVSPNHATGRADSSRPLEEVESLTGSVFSLLSQPQLSIFSRLSNPQQSGRHKNSVVTCIAHCLLAKNNRASSQLWSVLTQVPGWL
jgi:hypothetical protein